MRLLEGEHVPYLTAELRAGDSLYIPEGWWHQVHSDARTIAINYWWDGLHLSITQHTPHAVPYLFRTFAQVPL